MNVLLIFLFAMTFFLLALRVLQPVRARFRPAIAFAVELGLLLLAMIAGLWYECTIWSLVAILLSAALAYQVSMRAELERATLALGTHRFVIYVLSVFGTALLVLVAIPITTFLTSPGEIAMHMDRLLRVNTQQVMVIVYSAAILYMLLSPPELRSALAMIAAGAFCLCWIYAFAMPFGYPMLSGLAFEQVPRPLLSGVLRALVDFSVVIAVGLGLRCTWQRVGTRAIIGALLIANFSIVLAAGISMGREQIGLAGGGTDPIAGPGKLLKLSRSHPNTVFIFLDRFMGSYVESILADDPSLAQRLDGFTWFPRTVSAGENSIAGLHPLLGGYDYMPDEMNKRGASLRDLSVEAFSILPYNFASKGYRVSMVNPRGLGFTMQGDCDFIKVENISCSHIPASISHNKAKELGFPINSLAEANYADLLVLLGAMRVAPYAMKDALYARGPWRPFLDHSAGTTFREWAELGALEELTEIDEAQPSFNFISNILPHEPYFMGLDCTPKTESLSVPREELSESGHSSLFSLQHANTARCALNLVADYLDYLKREGVYENTTILIGSDHGIVGDVLDNSRRAVAGGTTENRYVRLRPLMMVKKSGASGSLKVSEQFMPNAEGPAILCEDIGGCINPYLASKSIAALGRDDPFFVSIVPWQFSAQKPDAFVFREQLVLKGKDPLSSKAWISGNP